MTGIAKKAHPLHGGHDEAGGGGVQAARRLVQQQQRRRRHQLQPQVNLRHSSKPVMEHMMTAPPVPKQAGQLSSSSGAAAISIISLGDHAWSPNIHGPTLPSHVCHAHDRGIRHCYRKDSHPLALAAGDAARAAVPHHLPADVAQLQHLRHRGSQLRLAAG